MHAEGAGADERGESGDEDGGEHDRQGEREAVSSKSIRWYADDPVDLESPGERGGGEGADAGERHLAERELAGPAGEDGQRQRADGVGGDGGVEQCREACVTTNGATSAEGEQHEHDDPVEVAHPEDRREPVGDGVDPGVEREHRTPPRARRDWSHTATSTTTSRRTSTRPGLVEEVEPDDALDEADRHSRERARCGRT